MIVLMTAASDNTTYKKSLDNIKMKLQKKMLSSVGYFTFFVTSSSYFEWFGFDSIRPLVRVGVDTSVKVLLLLSSHRHDHDYTTVDTVIIHDGKF